MDIKKELEKVDKDINKLSINFVDTRGRAQIANLIDKVQKRHKLPNFVSVVETEVELDGILKPVSVNIDMLEFLEGVNTDVPEKDAPKLKKLEKRRIALALLLESENED
jgi:hypothetical protein